ncbi:MAG: hypothetical protein ABI851_02940 [Saprospiraceae bacterium]
MILRTDNYKEGGFAIVFLDYLSGKAYKLFKSFEHPKSDTYNYNKEQFNKFRREVYNSEREAYELIQNSNLKEYFPAYYANTKINAVLDNCRQDISNQFLLDCCLTLELIQGESYKLNDNISNESIAYQNIDINSIFQSLDEIGVKFFDDANVFWNNGEIKIIDIATQDFVNFEKEEEC